MTPAQSRLLSFVIDYTDANNCSPSFNDMKAALGLASKSGVHRILKSLEKQGWISRPYHAVRDITIRRRPGQSNPYSPEALADLNPAKLEKLALDILLIQDGRRVAA